MTQENKYNSNTARKVIAKRIQYVISEIQDEVDPKDVIYAMLSEAGCYIACNTKDEEYTNMAVIKMAYLRQLYLMMIW